MAPGFSLSDGQRRTLAALCDTFVPALDDATTAEVVRRHVQALAARPGEPPSQEALDRAAVEVAAYCRLRPSEVGAVEASEELLLKHAPPDACRAISVILSALSTRAGMLAACGALTPFADMDLPSREAAMRHLSNSAVGLKRQVFSQLKTISCVTAFMKTRAFWTALGYPGPEPNERVEAALQAAGGRPEHKFQMLNSTITGDTQLDFDIVIVGTGCGGSVVAAELAAAGHRVLVLEKGVYAPRAEISGTEGDAFGQLYEGGGIISTEDSGVLVVAGSAFGGGTAINWACSLRTPEHVRQEWAKEHGLSHVASDDFGQSLDAVCSRIGVTAAGVSHNRNNQLLWEGCKGCGFGIEVAPQNMADVSPDAPGAGFICFGDRYGLKQNMTETYLRDAADARVPAKFLHLCNVQRVLHEAGAARGVEAEVVGAGGKLYRLEVRAPTVVVACGSINSPALLLRSKLPNRNGRIGKNLRLHPVAFVYGRMPSNVPDVNIWEGAPMTTVCNELEAGTDDDHYGVKLECPSVHPGLASVMYPWFSGQQFKEAMLDYRRTAIQIALVRDRGSGEVRLDSLGKPRLYYPIAEHDRKSLLVGTEASIRVLAAAGVEMVGTSQDQAMGSCRMLPPPVMGEERQRAVEELVADTRQVGYPFSKSIVGSAHQMGTCKMGSSAEDSVVDPSGESWEVSGLYVADASTFPTSSGVNPMVTTLAMAHFIAQQMKKRLQPPSKL